MSNRYVAGTWSKQYGRLTNGDRQAVNQATNLLFQEKTKVFRKLNPAHDRSLCDEWLRLRDQVMQDRAQNHDHDHDHWLQSMTHRVTNGVQLASHAMETYVQNITTPWMEIARQELRRGVAVKPGKEAHPRIMMYSRTCPHLYAKSSQRRYMNRKGDEGFKWCSAFVNWCLKEVGISGTRNALALSWLNWGKPISKPQQGAIVILKTKSWNHVAFATEQGGRWKMLGGNQKPEHGKGEQCVSYQRIIPSQVVGYRMPI